MPCAHRRDDAFAVDATLRRVRLAAHAHPAPSVDGGRRDRPPNPVRAVRRGGPTHRSRGPPSALAGDARPLRRRPTRAARPVRRAALPCAARRRPRGACVPRRPPLVGACAREVKKKTYVFLHVKIRKKLCVTAQTCEKLVKKLACFEIFRDFFLTKNSYFETFSRGVTYRKKLLPSKTTVTYFTRVFLCNG